VTLSLAFLAPEIGDNRRAPAARLWSQASRRPADGLAGSVARARTPGARGGVRNDPPSRGATRSSTRQPQRRWYPSRWRRPASASRQRWRPTGCRRSRAIRSARRSSPDRADAAPSHRLEHALK
jgi:hypothetical protein